MKKWGGSLGTERDEEGKGGREEETEKGGRERERGEGSIAEIGERCGRREKLQVLAWVKSCFGGHLKCSPSIHHVNHKIVELGKYYNDA